jgi:hypothetical protein
MRHALLCTRTQKSETSGPGQMMMGNWKMKMTTMTCPRKGTTPPQKRRRTMSQPRRTRRQGVSYTPGHLMKTMVGTPTTEPMATMAPLVMTVPETTAATTVVAMIMVMLGKFLQSSDIDFQAPTGGSVSVDVSS